MFRSLLVLAALAAAAPAAHADDEGSEHSAVLAGADADTIGVYTGFDEKSGWSMTVREKPGAVAQTLGVAVPAAHAHYVVYVSPGRTAITWIEISAGADTRGFKITGKRPLAWVYSPQGKLLRTFSYGSVFTAKQLTALRRSVSHVSWLGDFKTTAAGFEATVDGTKRTIVLDTKATTLR